MKQLNGITTLLIIIGLLIGFMPTINAALGYLINIPFFETTRFGEVFILFVSSTGAIICSFALFRSVKNKKLAWIITPIAAIALAALAIVTNIFSFFAY